MVSCGCELLMFLVCFEISDCIAGGPRTERHWACVDLQGEISVKQFFNVMIITINSLDYTWYTRS